MVDDGEVMGVVALGLVEEEEEGGSPLRLSQPHAIASPKPTKPVQPAPSSKTRLALCLPPVCS